MALRIAAASASRIARPQKNPSLFSAPHHNLNILKLHNPPRHPHANAFRKPGTLHPSFSLSNIIIIDVKRFIFRDLIVLGYAHKLNPHMLNFLCFLFLAGSQCYIRAISEAAAEPAISKKEEEEQWKIKMLYDGDCPLCMREVHLCLFK